MDRVNVNFDRKVRQMFEIPGSLTG